MPRPLRIEFQNAFYHVMNRGAARNDIFLNKTHYQAFLNIIKESCERFNCTIHAYCLMSNHYHLIIQTADANLGRVMRHINGVYTQRYNKLQKVDGPLFRGRYKAILIDEDSYLLELSRYIHRNPIEIKSKTKKLTNNLCDYQWSSYQSYLNIANTPKWLNKARTLSMFQNDEDILKRYELFVLANSNDKKVSEIEEFFKKKHQDSIFGKADFQEKVLIKLSDSVTKKDAIKKQINKNISVERIVDVVAKNFDVSNSSIMNRQIGRQRFNLPRSIAIYLIQKYKDYTLRELAEIFGLKHCGSVSYSISVAKKAVSNNSYKMELERVGDDLYFMKRT